MSRWTKRAYLRHVLKNDEKNNSDGKGLKEMRNCTFFNLNPPGVARSQRLPKILILI